MAYQPKSYRKFVATAATATLVATAFAPFASAHSFKDVEEKYNEAVDFLVSKGVNGYTDGTFKTQKTITRLEAAEMLGKALGLTEVKDAPASGFTDVPARVATLINAFKAEGITSGKTATTFGSNDEITRGELAIWLQRAFDLEAKEGSTNKFADVADRYKEAVQALVDNGITQGTSETTFGTTANAKRGDFALFVKRAHDAANQVEVEAAVESVNAINATQVEVKFTQEVNKDEAETVAKYKIAGVSPNTAVLGSDEKTVTLTFTSAAEVEGENKAVVVEPIQTAKDELVSTKRFAGVYTYEDKTNAEIKSITSSTNDEVATSATIEFSEPVVDGVVKVNGVSYGKISDGTTPVTEYDLTGLKLDASATHKIEIVNLEDTGENVNALVSKEFSVTKDVEAPTVSKVEAYTDQAVLVTFSERMDETTIDNTVIVVKDETLSDLTVDTVEALSTDETGTKFVVTLDESTLFDNKSSRNLTVLFKKDAIADSVGNTLDMVTKSVTLTKDTVAPKVTGISYKKNADGEVTKVVFEFSEALAAKTVTGNSVVVVDENGVKKAGFLKDATITAGETTVEFELATAAKLAGKYSFTFAKGLVEDLALTANASAAYQGVIDFGASTTEETFAIADATATTNIITVEFGTAVKGGAASGSATDASRYLLNGKALPEGTTITLDEAQETATITLPEGTIAVDDEAAIFTVNGVKSLDGKTNEAFTTTVEVNDNVAPELKSATLTSYDASGNTAVFTLTFSEAVALETDNVVSDELVIKNNGAAVAVTDATAELVAGYDKQIKVTVTGITLNIAKDITLTTVDVEDNTIVDASTLANELKGDTTVTVSK